MQIKRAALLTLLTVFSTWALALPSDRDKPIHVKSQRADFDTERGLTVYTGDVVVTQGTTLVTGEVVTIKTVDRKVVEVSSKGGKKPAYYEEDRSGDQGKVKAWGQLIRYNLQANQVELIDNARLHQNGDNFTGEKIVYDTTSKTVNASGNDSGRVQMVIKPQRLSK